MLLSGNRSLGVNLLRGDDQDWECSISARWTGRTIFPSRKCSRTITALTDAGSSKVRNAKHLDRPVESRMIVQASTLPNWEKYFLSDSGITS
jgi:hypothetical protein